MHHMMQSCLLVISAGLREANTQTFPHDGSQIAKLTAFLPEARAVWEMSWTQRSCWAGRLGRLSEGSLRHGRCAAACLLSRRPRCCPHSTADHRCKCGPVSDSIAWSQCVDISRAWLTILVPLYTERDLTYHHCATQHDMEKLRPNHKPTSQR